MQQLRVHRGSVTGLIFTATNDRVGAKFARLAVGGGLELRRRQQDGNNEKQQTEEGREPAAPEAQRKHDQGGAAAAERDANQGPGLLIAVKLEQLGGPLQEEEEGGAENAFDALEEILLISGDDCRCRAHGIDERVLYLREQERE